MITFSLLSIQLPSWRLFFDRAGGWVACFALSVLSIGTAHHTWSLLDFWYSPGRGLLVNSILFVPIYKTFWRAE